MANPVFIAVGGTGQTVLASYLRLAELAGFTPAPFYVVDSDRLGPLSRKVTELRSRAKKTVGGGEIAHRWMIDPFPTADAERRTFGSLFGNLTGERREVFNCLFSEGAEFTRIRTGMYGRPSIGATSIRYKLLKDDDDLKEMKNTLRGGEKHIILVGSCFGGTGSGGVPMLAHEFSKLNEQEGYNLKIDAITFLPWFRLFLPPGVMKTDDKSLHERLNENFEPNAAAGIYYFKDKIRDYVDTLILIGVEDPGMIRRESNEDNQGEDIHILNLLAALLIQNHFTEHLKPPKGVAGYWYDKDEKINPKTMIIQRDERSNPISLINVIKRTAVRKEWLEKLIKFFENYGQIHHFHKPAFLNVALEKLKGPIKTEAQVLGEIIEHLTKQLENVNEGFTWLEAMEDNIFFPLSPGDKKVQAEEYESKLSDPLPVIKKWCDEEKLPGEFVDPDFQSSEVFCEKLSNLFFDNLLIKEIKL
jgi:hypothetical protein